MRISPMSLKNNQCRPFVQIGFKFFDALWGEVEAWAGWMQKLRRDAMQLDIW